LQNQSSFFEKVKEKSHELSPKQTQLAKYLMNNYKSAAFQNIIKIAKDAEVSEATVVRLATTLDYSGFPEMLDDLQKIVQYELSAFESIRNTYKGEKIKQLNVLETVINYDQKNVQKTLQSVLLSDIEWIAHAIQASKKVIIVGLYASSFLAQYFGYNLGKVKENVHIINEDSVVLNNILLDCGPDTIVFLTAFPRYPKKIQYLGEMFKKKGANVIGITDSILSPLKAVSNKLLIVPLQYMSFTDPCCAILFLLQSIIMEFMSIDPEGAEEKLGAFDDYVEQMKYFK